MIRLRSLFDLVTKHPDHRACLSKRPQPFRPALEALEARDAPSGLGHPTDYSGFLTDSGRYGDGGAILVVGHGHNATYIYGGY